MTTTEPTTDARQQAEMMHCIEKCQEHAIDAMRELSEICTYLSDARKSLDRDKLDDAKVMILNLREAADELMGAAMRIDTTILRFLP